MTLTPLSWCWVKIKPKSKPLIGLHKTTNTIIGQKDVLWFFSWISDGKLHGCVPSPKKMNMDPYPWYQWPMVTTHHTGITWPHSRSQSHGVRKWWKWAASLSAIISQCSNLSNADLGLAQHNTLITLYASSQHFQPIRSPFLDQMETSANQSDDRT